MQTSWNTKGYTNSASTVTPEREGASHPSALALCRQYAIADTEAQNLLAPCPIMFDIKKLCPPCEILSLGQMAFGMAVNRGSSNILQHIGPIRRNEHGWPMKLSSPLVWLLCKICLFYVILFQLILCLQNFGPWIQSWSLSWRLTHRNLPIPKMAYHAKFCCSSSNATAVCRARPKNLGHRSSTPGMGQ